MLPRDSHVHSQWSWDALRGSMESACLRAIEIGLPALVFTEHADFTAWMVPDSEVLPVEWMPLVGDDVLTPPALDLDGYLESLDRCRGRFPGLRILSGVELSEPHWHTETVGDLVQAGEFDLVISSVHSMTTDAGLGEVSAAYDARPAADVVRDYLAETLRMIEQYDGFEVLAHLDYPLRYWPSDAGRFDPGAFEEEFRAVLRALARRGKTLEFNTKVPLSPRILRWWYAEGGGSITFASDAHEPGMLGRGFLEAVSIAKACGFRPGTTPYDAWDRQGRG
jgi:histidinol-phosphatase (PHP family)